MLIADSKTGQPLKKFGSYLASCRRCNLRFIVSEAQGLALLALQPADGVMRDDYLCPRCEYNLKGHRVGDRCPECGLEILSARLVPGRIARGPARVWDWLLLVFFAALTLAYFLTYRFPRVARVGSCLLIMAAGLTI